jgi:hypothetical protein
MRIWHFQTLPIMQKMVDALRECLLFSGTATVPALTGIKQAAPEVLFWILFTGGLASQGHEGHSWFVDQARDLAGDLGLCEWGDGREILGRFFYTEQPEEQGGEQLWRQLCLHAWVKGMRDCWLFGNCIPSLGSALSLGFEAKPGDQYIKVGKLSPNRHISDSLH